MTNVDAVAFRQTVLEVAIDDILAYRAPFLIEKLVKNRIADSEQEAEVLFAEVKKYLVITRSDTEVNWKMYSVRVDEAWHQFILYTDAYTDFCDKFFGGYVGHSPGNLPEATAPPEDDTVSTLEGFSQRYFAFFGTGLPEVWHDARAVTPWRRVFNDSAGRWHCRESDGVVELLSAGDIALMSVNAIAYDALAFIARTDVFYVRELPGNLTDEEKVGLVSCLVQYKMLRLAP